MKQRRRVPPSELAKRADRVARRLWPGLLPPPPQRDLYVQRSETKLLLSWCMKGLADELRLWYAPKGQMVTVALTSSARP